MHNKRRLLFVFVVVTLLFAYAYPLMFPADSDYISEFAALFPEADEFVLCQGEPPVYRAVSSMNNTNGTTIGYVGLGTAVGYEGPVLTAVACELDGTIRGIAVLDHTEGMTWYMKVESAGFMRGFAGRKVTDPLALDVDVDGVTAATFTARAITDGVREVSHAIARGQLHLPVTSVGRSLGLSVEALAVLAIWGVVLLGVLVKENRLRWLTLFASLVVLGFWLAAPISFSSLAGLLLGRVPPLETAHLVWYLLVVGVLGTVLFFGRNLYCYWVCPFGAVQELLALAGGINVTPSARLRRVLRLARPLLVWGALVIALVTRSPSVAGYEPFGTLFAFTGTSMGWIFLVFVVILGVASTRFFCLHFCPVGYLIDLSAQARRRVRGLLRDRPHPSRVEGAARRV